MRCHQSLSKLFNHFSSFEEQVDIRKAERKPTGKGVNIERKRAGEGKRGGGREAETTVTVAPYSLCTLEGFVRADNTRRKQP